MQKELIATFWAKNKKNFWTFTQKDICKKLESLDDNQAMRLMTTSFSQNGWTALGVILLCIGGLGCLIRTISSILSIYWYHTDMWGILEGLVNPTVPYFMKNLIPHFIESIAIILLGIIVLCVIRKVYSLKKFFTLIDSMPNNIQNNEETITEQATNN